MRILLAVDGSACSAGAVDELMARFHSANTEVRVLHAVEWLKEMPLSFQFGQGPTPDGDPRHVIVDALRNGRPISLSSDRTAGRASIGSSWEALRRGLSATPAVPSKLCARAA